MISAGLYIAACSAKNRIRRRLARLREPRYLVGAVAAVVYFYLWFGVRARARRGVGRSRPAAASAPVLGAIYAAGSALAGAAVLVVAALAWAVPFESGLLTFSDAETDFLFPAPVTRRQLLLYRLLRSQAGIVFGSVVIAFASPSGGWKRLQISIAIWMLFLILRTYYTAVTLTRSRAVAGGSAAMTAWAPLAAIAAAGVVVVAGIVQAFAARPVSSIAEALDRLATATNGGWAGIALWPFAAPVRPLFVESASSFIAALGASAVVLACTVGWMLYSDDTFQEAAAWAAARRPERLRTRDAAVRARRTGLSLAASGPTELAFFWKNGVQTLRMNGAMAIRILIALVGITVGIASAALNALHVRGGAAAACAVSIAVAGFIAVLGPQVVRTDLRSDLLHLDMLKTWPVRAGAVVRGELSWPATMLTLFGWAAIVSALAFSPAAFPAASPALRLSIAAAAAALMPAVVAAHYLVQNTAALAFPAWVPLGHARPRGVDAMGQRLIMLAGALLAMALLLVPGLVAAGVVWLAVRRWIDSAALVVAALICTAVVLLEVLVATELLGPLYDRLDVLSIERAE